MSLPIISKAGGKLIISGAEVNEKNLNIEQQMLEPIKAAKQNF